MAPRVHPVENHFTLSEVSTSSVHPLGLMLRTHRAEPGPLKPGWTQKALSRHMPSSVLENNSPCLGVSMVPDEPSTSYPGRSDPIGTMTQSSPLPSAEWWGTLLRMLWLEAGAFLQGKTVPSSPHSAAGLRSCLCPARS